MKNCKDLENIRVLMDILSRHQLDNWIDSGTLLGLIRDGCLIATDPDIDISLVVDDDCDLPVMELEKFGFHILVVKMICEKVYKLKIHHQQISREIDISVFTRDGDDLVSPVLRYCKLSELLRQYKYFKFILVFILKSRQLIKRRLKLKNCINYSTHVHKRSLRKSDKWVYKAATVLPPRYSKELGVNLPNSVNDHLESRYGAWGVYNPSWVSELDDGCFVRTNWSDSEIFLKDCVSKSRVRSQNV